MKCVMGIGCSNHFNYLLLDVGEKFWKSAKRIRAVLLSEYNKANGFRPTMNSDDSDSDFEPSIRKKKQKLVDCSTAKNEKDVNGTILTKFAELMISLFISKKRLSLVLVPVPVLVLLINMIV